MKKILGRAKLSVLGVLTATMIFGSTAFAYMYPICDVFRGGNKYEVLEDTWTKHEVKKTVYALTDKYEHHNLGRVGVRLGKDIKYSIYGNQGLYVELSETKTFPASSLGYHESDFSSSSWWWEER